MNLEMTGKILSVDDSAIVRKIIKATVDVLGFDFLEAENGQHALEVLAEHHADTRLILMDHNMPIKDGITTLQELKKTPDFADIPVMMITSEGDKQIVVQAIQAGAKHYLTKPFTQQDLMTKIMECLGLGWD